MRKKNTLVYGVGVNDADYPVSKRTGKKQILCPFYQTWKSMLKRCYSAKCQESFPAYIGCSVDPEWHSFMAFRAWMIEQDWQGSDIDKDILAQGNKTYGAKTCIFISQQLNKFTTDSAATRGKWPIGVCWDESRGKFQAKCSNPLTGKNEHLGRFACPDAAHEAWRKRKHEIANQLAGLQKDERLANALRERYTPNE